MNSLKRIEPLLHQPRFVGRLAKASARLKVAVTQTGWGLQRHPLVAADYGFNVGDHVGDNPAEVALRRQVLEEWVGSPILWLNQVHGCAVADAAGAIRLGVAQQADASVCCVSDVCLAIMTADCLPVIFVASDTDGVVRGVGAAHAGWRGLHAGVLRACAIELSSRCGLPIHQISAWLGPAIGPQSFEVGGEVRQAFVNLDSVLAECFAPSSLNTDKFFADIYALARLDLGAVGIVDVQGGGEDTLSDPHWFSHRRGQQRGQAAGRMATLVRLLP
ncbi:MAG TPA: laccase domain-containing protein [Limnobacter sp.]|nr:laccase domain-containing protein [Limnobacter sp.]